MRVQHRKDAGPASPALLGQGAPLARPTLAEAIADRVADEIAAGALRPGERVIETALAQRLGVSRVPVREALKVLHAQGIVAGGGHRGWRVAAFDAAWMRQVMEVRLDLECRLLRGALRMWRGGGGGAGWAALRSALDDLRRAARAREPSRALRADLSFHRAIASAADHPLAARLWEGIARHVLIVFSLERRQGADLAALVRQHEALWRDIDRFLGTEPHDAELRAALAAHIMPGDPAPGGRDDLSRLP